jgi:hypothetical protein
VLQSSNVDTVEVRYTLGLLSTMSMLQSEAVSLSLHKSGVSLTYSLVGCSLAVGNSPLLLLHLSLILAVKLLWGVSLNESLTKGTERFALSSTTSLLLLLALDGKVT